MHVDICDVYNVCNDMRKHRRVSALIRQGKCSVHVSPVCVVAYRVALFFNKDRKSVIVCVL